MVPLIQDPFIKKIKLIIKICGRRKAKDVIKLLNKQDPINEIDKYHYEVNSQFSDGKYQVIYDFNKQSWQCSCEGYRNEIAKSYNKKLRNEITDVELKKETQRKRCKHILAVFINKIVRD